LGLSRFVFTIFQSVSISQYPENQVNLAAVICEV